MSKKLELLDYTDCIANLPNSILKHFQLPTVGQPLALADRFLDKKYKNIVVLLLDGMGTNILENNLSSDDFFHKYFVQSYHSVFPPTTVAATTSIITGLQPIEDSWLGWDEYFPQIDKNITVFLNLLQGTDQPAAQENVAHTYCDYKTIVERLNEAGKTAYDVTPFAAPFPENFEEICQLIESYCNQPEEKYIYAYWDQPDSTMHKFGAYSLQAKEMVRNLEAQVEKLAGKLSDTLLIVTADHGHVNASRNVTIEDYPKIKECLLRTPSIEARALNLYVKEDKKKQLEEEFNKEFGKDYILLSKEEVYQTNLFGTGKPHPNVDAMIGDYVAIATADLSIFNSAAEVRVLKGVHAGYTKEEMTIPFIVYSSKK